MKTKWQYDWSGGSGVSELEGFNEAKIKKDIEFMIVRGCSTRDLRAKMEKLNSLSTGML